MERPEVAGSNPSPGFVNGHDTRNWDRFQRFCVLAISALLVLGLLASLTLCREGPTTHPTVRNP